MPLGIILALSEGYKHGLVENSIRRKAIPILPLGPHVPVCTFKVSRILMIRWHGRKVQTCKQDISHLSQGQPLTSLRPHGCLLQPERTQPEETQLWLGLWFRDLGKAPCLFSTLLLSICHEPGSPPGALDNYHWEAKQTKCACSCG